MSSSQMSTRGSGSLASDADGQTEEELHSNTYDGQSSQSSQGSKPPDPKSFTLVEREELLYRKTAFRWIAPQNLSDQTVPHIDEGGTPWGYLFCLAENKPHNPRRYNFHGTDRLEQSHFEVMVSLGKWQASYENLKTQSRLRPKKSREQHLVGWLTKNAKEAFDQNILLIRGPAPKTSFCRDTYFDWSSQKLQEWAIKEASRLRNPSTGAEMSRLHSFRRPSEPTSSTPYAQRALPASQPLFIRQLQQTQQRQQSQPFHLNQSSHSSADRPRPPAAPDESQSITSWSKAYTIEQAALYQLWSKSADPDEQAPLSKELWASARKELEEQIKDIRARMSTSMRLPGQPATDEMLWDREPNLEGGKALRTALNKITCGLRKMSSAAVQTPYDSELPSALPSPFNVLFDETKPGSPVVKLEVRSFSERWFP